MKKQLFTLVFALVAMLGFQTVNAQSLASYESSFDNGELTVSGKVGGLGNSTKSMVVTLYLEIVVASDCSNTTGGPNPKTIIKTFTKSSSDDNSAQVSGRGFGFFNELKVRAVGDGDACNGAWDFVSANPDATVERAWIVITGYDSNLNIVKQSEEIDINW